MAVSYKPQKISPKFQGTVRQLLHNKIRESYIHPQFVTDILKPLQRCTLETWHMRSQPHPFNREEGILPHVYDALIC